MASSLTTAMLAMSNDPLGRGVVWCFPMEDAVGATSTLDVSTSSNSTLTGGGSSIVHGISVPLGSPDSVTGAISKPGASAVVPGAAYSWTNPTSPAWGTGTGNNAILKKTITASNFDAVMGSNFSIFAVVNMPAIASTRTGSILQIGGVRLYMASDGNRYNATFFYTPAGGTSTTFTLVSNEPIPAGVHTVEIAFDGVILKMVVDGSIQAATIIGLNASGLPATITSTSFPSIGLTGSGYSTPLTGVSINNVLVLNRTMDRDEHVKFARMVNAVGADKFPFRHRLKDAYVPATKTAALASRGCAGCGGDMTVNEASVTDSLNRKFHPGCLAAYTLASPFTNTATYSQITDNLARFMVANLEVLLGGVALYHDGTRYYAGADGEANIAVGTVNNAAFERSLLDCNGAIADLAEYLRVPPNHWLWKIVREEIERAFTFQVGTPAIQDGRTPQAQTLSSGSHGYGAISMNIMSGSTLIAGANDVSYVTFCAGGFMSSVLRMKPYVSKFEPDNWARWMRGVEALGEFIWNGYQIAPPAYWLYTPNGNWALNLMYGIFAIWRVTEDPVWYDRFKRALELTVCPLSQNLIPGQPTTYNTIPTSIPKNAFGNYTPRGMWNPGSTYNYGDQVGVPFGAGGTTPTDWVGNWVSGQSYTPGQLVKDTGFTSASTTTMYYLCKNNVTSSTRPSQDTANWSANMPPTWGVYLCQNPSGVNGGTSPVNDTTNWFCATTSASYQQSGFYGLQGVAGSDTTNWTDYKAWFAEWPGIGNSNGVPGSEMQGLPGYDGDYTQLDVTIISNVFALMGGAKGPNKFTQQTEWQRVKCWINALTNQQLQYVTINSSAATINNTNGAAGGYSMRHTLTDTWRNCPIFSLIANGERGDIQVSNSNVTVYNFAKVFMSSAIPNALSNYNQNSYNIFTDLVPLLALDPTR